MVGAKNDAAHQGSHDDEEAALWHEVRQPMVKMKTYLSKRCEEYPEGDFIRDLNIVIIQFKNRYPFIGV